MKRRFFVLIIVIVLAFLVGGCIFGRDTDNDPNKDTPHEEVRFDIGNLNYNSAYQSQTSSGERGFIINDKIDFNLITYTGSLSSYPIYVLKQDGVTLAEIRKYSGGEYPLYNIITSGDMVLEIYLGDWEEKLLFDSFTLKVASGGFPTRVEIAMYDENDNLITTATGGTSLTLKALVYSGDTLLDVDDEKFVSGWRGVSLDSKPLFGASQLDGGRYLQIDIPNLPTLATLTCLYEYVPKVTNLKQTNTFTIDLQSNLEKLHIDWGLGEANGKLGISYNFGYLLDNVDAYYLFTNGDTEQLNIAFRENSKDGDLIPFIKYNGEEDFAYYTGQKISYAPAFDGFDDTFAVRYVANGVKYYFNPQKNSAEIYLAHRYSEKGSVGTVTKFRKAEESALSLTLVKDSPTSIKVSSIKGWELEHTESLGIKGEKYVTFTRHVINGKTQAKIFVSNTKKSTATKNNQHFIPQIEVTGAVYSDYYFRYNWHQVQRLVDGKFYGEAAGVAQIEVISCQNPDIKFVLDVDIQNPIIEEQLEYRLQIELYLAYDPSPYILVKEFFYNYDTNARPLAQGETLKYYDYRTTSPREMQAADFTHQNRKYNGDYIIRLERGGKIVSSNYLKVNSYISPDYYIEISGIKYLMSEIQDTMYSGIDLPSYLPYIETEEDIKNIKLYKKTINNTFVEVDTAEASITTHGIDNIYYVYYRHFEDNKTNKFNARICAIKVV